MGGSTGRSNACFQTLNPTWNTKMCLYVRDAGSDVLRVSGGWSCAEGRGEGGREGPDLYVPDAGTGVLSVSVG